MAIASLVLGIISLVCSLFGVWALLLAVPTGIVGIILGILARKNDPERRGMATAGLICSIIGVVLGLIVGIACLVCVGAAAGALSSMR